MNTSQIFDEIRGGPNIRIRIIIRIIRPEIIRQNIRIIRSNIRRILQFFFLKKVNISAKKHHHNQELRAILIVRFVDAIKKN